MNAVGALLTASCCLAAAAAMSVPIVRPAPEARAQGLDREVVAPRTGPDRVAVSPRSGPERGITVVPPEPVSVATSGSLEVYAGFGAWVDAFDHGRAYQRDGGAPPVGTEVVDTLVRHGVRTLYLQVTRTDDRSPDGWVDRERSVAIIEAAHDAGIAVVGWYLPRFESVEVDLTRLRMLVELRTPRGDRLDGVGVDIEANQPEPSHDTRSARLVELGEAFRPIAAEAGLPVAGIVMPPLHLEQVNPRFWPGFPWGAISDHYDVWMPMAYWSLRAEGTRFADAAAYTADNVIRLRELVGDQPMHPIGGVADGTTPAELAAFVRAARQVGSIGFSVYDVDTTDDAEWAAMVAAAR